MILYNEDEYLQLSGIQHFAFCRRQWALAYIELQWSENVRTVEGKLLHEKAHDVSSAEKRGDLIISRAMPIYSRELGISGECDIVEFHKTEKGINLTGREGHFEVVPIEYKRGSPKQNDIDILQLTAQVLCLEEMLCCRIPYGYLFYGETRRRKKVEFDSSIRQKTKDVFQEMHQYYERRYTPRVRRTKACNACSLKDICLPALGINKSASAYISKVLSEEES
ncbi:CRISPR-associated protein Cas4 [Clostridium sp. C105KSO13]|uniref:CRISPR-associated protein Cas4 n=1 Tax=Clostridium sp. C105KSO13 TaxID=1776045 RepID=UPI000B7CEFB6|nr:CRISPR-associated protein Cas4 [Clostridium sp. C105KSO13]